MKNTLLILLIICTAVFAAEDISPTFANETIMNFSAGGVATFENELVVEKEFDVLRGLVLGFESLTCLEDLKRPAAGEELTFALGFGLSDKFSLGLAQKVLLNGTETEGALDMVFAFEKEFEDAEFVISDENEFLFNQTSKGWEYANTFGLEKAFSITEMFGIVLFLENEYAIAFDKKARGEDTLKAGPGITYDWLGFQVRYVMGISAAVDHGVEASVLLSFE